MFRVANSNYGDTNTEIFVHAKREAISNHIINNKNFFEVEFLDYIAKKYNKQTGILDIGANIGNHALFFAKFLSCDMVYAFEPYPANVSVLRKNLERFADKSKVYDIALSNKEGTMTLYNSQKRNFGGFSLHDYQNGISFVVSQSINVITLDSLNLNGISMIKIDVENHENEVLEGAKQTILRNKPIIFIENLYYGYPAICPNPDPHNKILEELGYHRIEKNIEGSYMDLWVPK